MGEDTETGCCHDKNLLILKSSKAHCQPKPPSAKLYYAFFLSYKVVRIFFSRASSTLFSRISIAEFYSKTRDKRSNFVLVTVCGGRRATKFDFAVEMEGGGEGRWRGG